jgi:hypothetical protein
LALAIRDEKGNLLLARGVVDKSYCSRDPENAEAEWHMFAYFNKHLIVLDLLVAARPMRMAIGPKEGC